jgi:hypothetical protein
LGWCGVWNLPIEAIKMAYEIVVKAIIRTPDGVEVLLGSVENNVTTYLHSEKLDHEPSDEEIESMKEKFKNLLDKRKSRGKT